MPGTVVTAVLVKAGSMPITVVSVYGLIQKRANGIAYAVPSVHSVLNDLTATLDVRRSRQSVMLAGDLNVSPQILVSSEASDDEAAWALSDHHCPVVAEFDVS